MTIQHNAFLRRCFLLAIVGFFVFGLMRNFFMTPVVRAQSPAGSFLFNPPTKRIVLDTTFPVVLTVDTADERKVNVAQLKVAYPADVLSVVGCTAADGYQSIAGQTVCQAGNGLLSVNVQSTSAEGKNHVVPLATVTFKVLKQRTLPAQVTLDQQQIVVKDASGASVLLALGTIGKGSYQTGAMLLTSPTPGADSYTIAIGTTNSLTIQIGPAVTSTPGGPTPTAAQPTPTVAAPTPTPTTASNPVPDHTPYLRFGVSLFGVENTPDITVRLRLADLVAQLTPPAAPPPTGPKCTTPEPGEYIFTDVSMTADSQGTYWPKPGGIIRTSSAQYQISSDGWVPLVGIPSGDPYTIAVKAEKHRSSKLANQITLFEGQLAGQNINWSSLPLEPGDLPNPNNGLAQDCTVNSTDLSLITARIGATDADSLKIGDVNYDNVINGNDVSKVVHTLSTKPDDDQ